LFRFLVTGACTVLMTGAGFTIAGAAETALPPTVTVATAAVDVAAPAPRAANIEIAAPTAGADLAMWGLTATTGAVEPSGSVESRLGSRLVRRFADGILARSATLAFSLTRNAMRFLGVRYVYGGTGGSGFDCSGYVQHVYALLGLRLPRTADAQYSVGRRVQGNAAPGDLVFFQTYAAGASHVGIYLGHDRFVHASSSRGVIVSNLHERYWSARYLGAKRLI